MAGSSLGLSSVPTGPTVAVHPPCPSMLLSQLLPLVQVQETALRPSLVLAAKIKHLGVLQSRPNLAP